MQATKMNANSRRILERKLKNTADVADGAAGDGGIVAGQYVNSSGRAMSNVERVANSRRAVKKVPTQSLDLSFSSRNKPGGTGVSASVGANAGTSATNSSTFAPKINKRSIQIAQAKREGRIEDHLLKQAEISKKKKAEADAKKLKD